MEWSEVVDNPMFANLPFKIELTRFGKVLMSPASNEHGYIQSRLVTQFGKKENGIVITECSIQTAEGVKVADVAWLSDDFVKQHGFTTPYPKAPELCVEIMPPSNSMVEMNEKIQLYLATGAVEVWVVHGLDKIECHSKSGIIEQSNIFPNL
ncbi:Uma2 family endonuclease [Ectothiorhodospiraceae bacterium BW-2]|nr:Uma2 family endonuclease [Ectothiorhodospiraceae bacterium BW-2]